MLTEYFPKRYFILKSLTQYDLDLSVEKGVWATQRHNEGILDQAFRTSTHVYLIFGVNKSGEFYGCARMAGLIPRNEATRSETKVHWASRTDSAPGSRSSLLSLASRESSSFQQRNLVLSPSEKRYLDNSPIPVTPESEKNPTAQLRRRGGTNSAPAELQQLHRNLTFSTPDPQNSFDQLLKAENSVKSSMEFHLDPNAPSKAVRQPPPSNSATTQERGLETISEPSQEESQEEYSRQGQEEHDGQEQKKSDDMSWGEPFKIEWIHTDRLPFHRTRHLRNPWNHNREIKVSRDGTELEPSVGQALLEEWDRTDISPSIPTHRPTGGGRNRGNAAAHSHRGRRERDGEEG